MFHLKCEVFTNPIHYICQPAHVRQLLDKLAMGHDDLNQSSPWML